MKDFGKLNFSTSFCPTSAFPLDSRKYFDSLENAQAAALTATEVGNSDSTYYIGETIEVVHDGITDLYQIQSDKSLKPVGVKSNDVLDIQVVNELPEVRDPKTLYILI